MTLSEAIDLGILEVAEISVGSGENGAKISVLRTPEISALEPRAMLWYNDLHPLPWRWALDRWPNDGRLGARHGGARTWHEALRASVLARTAC